MVESPDTNVRFNRDLMREVVRTCDFTSHSAKAFIEECVKACLEQVKADGTIVPVPGLIVMMRKKLGKETQSLEEAVRKMIREELKAKPARR